MKNQKRHQKSREAIEQDIPTEGQHFRRILEEWKVNVDLHKFHDNLGQQRFRHFLAIQTAFLAIFGLLIRESVNLSNCWLAFLATIASVFALTTAWHGWLMHRRGRFYIDAIKANLLLLEQEWQKTVPP